MVSLRVAYSSSLHSEKFNIVTMGKSKVVLKVANDTKHASSSTHVAPPTISSYDLVSQLQ